jgi:hypothetical protein
VARISKQQANSTHQKFAEAAHVSRARLFAFLDMLGAFTETDSFAPNERKRSFLPFLHRLCRFVCPGLAHCGLPEEKVAGAEYVPEGRPARIAGEGRARRTLQIDKRKAWGE